MKRDRPSDIGLLLLRIILFAIVCYYGSQKLFGLFGGPGLASTITELRHKFGLTPEIAQAILITEFSCACAVLLGFLTRIAALACACTTAMTAYSFGIAENYKDAHTQIPLMLCTIALALVFCGGGRASLEWMMIRGRKRSTKTAKA
jgi:putative oxidoreductase